MCKILPVPQRIHQFGMSEKPVPKRHLQCMHNECNQMVTPLSLIRHFKHVHANVPMHLHDRTKELQLVCNLSQLQYNRTICLAMMKMYESGLIDVAKSRSTASVKRVCQLLSLEIPINTFWVMISTTDGTQGTGAYAIVWVLSNLNNNSYQCTLEVTTKNGSMSLSTVCDVICLPESCMIEDIAEQLDCLLLSKSTCLSLLAANQNNVNVIVRII